MAAVFCVNGTQSSCKEGVVKPVDDICRDSIAKTWLSGSVIVQHG